MQSVLDQVQVVNPAFSRPTANLSGAALYEEDGRVLLTLVNGKRNATKARWYAVERIPTELGGSAFRLQPALGDKLANVEESYVVLLHGPASSCSCAGHQFTSGCKHLSALLHFHGEGRI
jgi:hypothetical protein